MPDTAASIDALEKAAKRLRNDVDALSFTAPVTHVYNPLRYAWPSHRDYLRRANPASTRVVFIGMNPGPWGMAQTGVPFGEIDAVRDYLGIDAKVRRPNEEHPKRPIDGFACQRSEVSGRRLWGLFKDRFPNVDDFFSHHFVINYCPLVFMEDSGKNRTPDKLPAAERDPLHQACDTHLRKAITILSPKFVVAVGAYAETCLRRCLPETMQTPDANQGTAANIVRILHPSPASPAANRDWSGTAHQQLLQAGVWNA